MPLHVCGRAILGDWGPSWKAPLKKLAPYRCRDSAARHYAGRGEVLEHPSIPCVVALSAEAVSEIKVLAWPATRVLSTTVGIGSTSQG